MVLCPQLTPPTSRVGGLNSRSTAGPDITACWWPPVPYRDSDCCLQSNCGDGCRLLLASAAGAGAGGGALPLMLLLPIATTPLTRAAGDAIPQAELAVVLTMRGLCVIGG